MAQGNPSGPDNDGDGGRQPAANCHDLVVAINALNKNYEAAQSERANHDRKTLFWGRIAGIGVGLYTLLTFGLLVINFWQLREVQNGAAQTQIAVTAATNSASAATRQANAAERDQRAWLSPELMELLAPIAVGSRIQLRIIYENSGKTPAFGFSHGEDGGALLVPDGFSDWDHIEIPENTTCRGILPLDTGPVIYPSVHFGNDLEYDATPKKDIAIVVNQIIAGRRILWMNGCFKYITLGKPHYSQFCYFLLPERDKPSEKWRFKSCPTGDNAD